MNLNSWVGVMSKYMLFKHLQAHVILLLTALKIHFKLDFGSKLSKQETQYASQAENSHREQAHNLLAGKSEVCGCLC
jgi:hypothetical protein